MNKYLYLLLSLLFPTVLLAQVEAGRNREPLKVIYINKDVSTHLVSPEAVS